MSDIISAALIVIGGGFMLLAGVGLLRMPDLFMRMQAATKAATLGAGCMLLAVAVHFGELTIVARALLVIAFVFLTAPVAAHMIARAAYSVGTPLWEGTLTDELRDQSQPPEEPQTDAGPTASSGPPSPVEDDGAH